MGEVVSGIIGKNRYKCSDMNLERDSKYNSLSLELDD